MYRWMKGIVYRWMKGIVYRWIKGIVYRWIKGTLYIESLSGIKPCVCQVILFLIYNPKNPANKYLVVFWY